MQLKFGFARVVAEDNQFFKKGEVLLGFSDTAPIFEFAPEQPTLKLVEGNWQDIVGYTVVKRGEGHGLLYKDQHQAETVAKSFNKSFKDIYECISLSLEKV